jgi:hypothetical protein
LRRWRRPGQQRCASFEPGASHVCSGVETGSRQCGGAGIHGCFGKAGRFSRGIGQRRG